MRLVGREDQRLWAFETRINEHEDWVPIYMFTETEFSPQDFEIANYWTSSSPRVWFTYQVVCMRMLAAREVEGHEALWEGGCWW